MPFAITPDPAYLYLSPRHQEALGHLLYGAGHAGGFVQLTGEVGTGKTTIIRTLLAQKLADVDVAMILNPRQSEQEFVASICDELHVAYEKGASIKALVDALNAHLLKIHAEGRRTVLIIDEAQNLAREVLEQVRLLTNLETHKEKLLRIMLVGQPELAELLARPDLRQLASRITARHHLTPLNAAETRAYIAHRLKISGTADTIFESAALARIHVLSGGVPRRINILCDRALLGAYGQNRKTITPALVRAAAKEVGGELPKSARGYRWSGFDLVLVTLILAVLGVWYLWPRAAPMTPPAVVAAPIPVVKPAPPTTVSMDQVLDSADALPSVLTRLTQAWKATPAPAAGEPLCKALSREKLECYRSTGGWVDLEQINRPAILALSTGRGETRHVLLRRHDGVIATLETARGALRVPSAQLDLLWNGDYLVLWRRETEPGALLAQAQGPAVLWLRERLAKLTGTAAPVNPSNFFDLPLRDEVVRFQQQRGLIADGVVGLRTMIALTDGATPPPPTLKGAP